MTARDRAITWEGFHNARDLGGLPTHDGRTTRRGVWIRSADPRFVTATGWRAAYDAGVRTIIDLRSEDEIRPPSTGALPGSDAAAPFAAFPPAAPGTYRSGTYAPAGMDRTEVSMEARDDAELWRFMGGERLGCTPLYYRMFLARKPDRCAAAVTAVARSRPGGVIFHCGAGRDRTGLLALLLLSLAGVPADVIATDYELTTEPLRALHAAIGRADESLRIEQILAAHGTTAREAILATLDGFDAAAYLSTAGVSADDLATLRSRILA